MYRARRALKLRGVESDTKLLVNLTRGSLVCDQIVIADTPRRRMRGLLGRDHLRAGEGMLLQPAPSIHTAFMRFAIDVLFVDGTLRVTKIVGNLRPWRMTSARHTRGVVELAGGEADRRGVAVGDLLGVVEVTDRLGAFVAGGEWKDGRWADSVATTPSNGHVASLDLHRGVHDDGRRYSDPNPPKVLLLGSDRRFRSVAAALLTRRGCSVTLADRMADIAFLAEREKADVVIWDAGVSLTDAARAAARVEGLQPPVGIVVVGEEAERSFAAMPVLAKWGSFDDLYAAVEKARPSRISRRSHAGG